MVKVPDIGSTCVISFQTKYPTFSQADFDSVMTELGFVRNVLPPTQQGAITQINYTKENMVVIGNLQTYTLDFQCFNTINILNAYGDIKQALAKLKIDPTSIHLMGLRCTTMAHDVGNPEDHLTSLINNDTKENISKSLGFEPSLVSFVLANKNPELEDFQIRIEPLLSNPKGSYFMEINYRTSSHSKFDSFIGKFGSDMIGAIAKSVDKSGNSN